MRLFFRLGILAVLGFSLFWFWGTLERLQDTVGSYIQNQDFLTLKARYTPQEILHLHRHELLKNETYSLAEPQLKFSPHLLLEVKYTEPNKHTREGILIWSLVNGEMVLNSDTWEQSHGFEDAMNAGASRGDFQVLNALARYKGKMTEEQLEHTLNVDAATLERMLESARRKHLITRTGGEVMLHFQNPRLIAIPQSQITQKLATMPYHLSQRLPKQYMPSQIKRTALAAFGQNFSIRNTQELFLPVYLIDVHNPDGSVTSTYWNALNGQKLTMPFSV